MADTTGRIPLWIIGTVAGILVIGLRKNSTDSLLCLSDLREKVPLSS
ncbi:putative photosystem II PsbJ [Helianthus annuus]|uniref:Photosystem II PsbJ n=1 Tax=Helianthus annuus TaxID=4232 RepID=A0A9K3N0E8_HELAN|nr:putative photosystem II PsbJ [Helianthus annuus]